MVVANVGGGAAVAIAIAFIIALAIALVPRSSSDMFLPSVIATLSLSMITKRAYEKEVTVRIRLLFSAVIEAVKQ